MKSMTIIMLAAALVAGAVMPAAGYEVVSGHPRLYVTASDLPALRAKCSGSMAYDYSIPKNWADDHMYDSLPLSSVDAYHHYLCTYSFIYLVTENPAYAGRAKAIAQSAIP